MTKEKIRRLCKIAYEYAENNDPFDDFLSNEGREVQRENQLTLGLFEEGFPQSLRSVIEDYKNEYDHNIVDEIIRKAKKREPNVKEIELWCSKKFIKRFNEVFSYANHGSDYNYSSFGQNSNIGKELLKHKGIKLYFKWFKK